MMKTSLKEWEPGVKVMNDLSAILIMGVAFALVLNQVEMIIMHTLFL